MKFYRCRECGKKLIGRLPNGLWYFVFGRKADRGGLGEYCPVELYIHGSVKIRCLSRTCNHLNILHYFPQTDSFEQSEKVLQSNPTEKQSLRSANVKVAFGK